MFKFYVVPDATKLSLHSAIYSAKNMKLFWDPRSESDAYAIVEAKGKSEINKASSLEFSILPTNVCYNDFHKKKSVVLAYDDDDLIFEGEVSANPRDFYKQRRITCTDPLTYLAGSIQPPDEKNEVVIPESSSGTFYVKVPLIWYEDGNPKELKWRERTTNSAGERVYKVSKDTTANPDKVYYYSVESSGENVSGTTITQKAATKETIQAHISRILSVHNTQADPFRQIFPGDIDTSDTEEHEFSSTGWRTSWDAFNSDILEDYGRYVKITTGNDGTLLLNYVDIKQMSSAAPVIEYTRNMIEMTESTDNNDDIFTVLVPIGKDNLTVSDVSDHDKGGNDEVDPYIASWGGAKRYVVVSKKAVARYGYIVKTQSFSDIKSASELYDKAVEYIKNNYDYHTEYDVKAIDLKVLGETDHRITVGDKCQLKSTWHGVDEKDLYVISAQYDYINPENDTFKLGIPTSDREAGNRRLSGQTGRNRRSGQDNASSAASGMGRLSSILESYIHVTEWGLEMNSRLKNEVESNDGKYMTRFLQDEEHLNLAAEKIFGIDGDGVGDQDAGYVKVLTSEYRDGDGDGPYKNPVTEHWFEFEKEKDKYVLSKDKTCDPSVVGDKTYYRQKLWSRYSSVDVGPGGIKARVDGNYSRSIACSSWIDANEDAITAITGHIHVDENGQIIVDSGSGFRTGHTDTKNETSYRKVPASWLSKPGANPFAEQWYVQAMENGVWKGEGKLDAATNGSYYDQVSSSETTVIPGKQYYYKNDKVETFTAEFGVYDENNLTGGILVNTINYPQYRIVSPAERKENIAAGKTPYQCGYWIYDEAAGTFGQAPENAKWENTKYYKQRSDSFAEMSLMGNRIIIGRPENYEGLSPDQKATIDKYVAKNNLDGTITEIATDVVSVNALFAKYIKANTIEADTVFSSDRIWANYLTVHHDLSVAGHIATPDIWINSNPEREATAADSIKKYILSTVLSDGVDHNGTIRPTIDGDTVTLKFWTLDNQEHSVSFDKPASLGTVTWSSGDNLTVKTAGGKTFFKADLTIPSMFVDAQLSYDKKGQNLGITNANNSLYSAPTLKARLSIRGTWSGMPELPSGETDHEITNWCKDFYIAAKKPYDDGKTDGLTEGISEAKNNFGLYGPGAPNPSPEELPAMNSAPVLDYNTNYAVYKTYNGERFGNKVFFKTPADRYETGKSNGISEAKGKFGLAGPSTATASDQNEAIAISNATTLSYGSSYMIYKTYDGSMLGSKTYFKTPSRGLHRTYAKVGNTVYYNGTHDLGYGESATVYGQYKMDGDEDYVNATGVIISQKAIGVDEPEEYNGDGTPAGAQIINNAQLLAYGKTYSVRATYGGVKVGNAQYFKAPSDSSGDVILEDTWSGRTTTNPNRKWTVSASNGLSKSIGFGEADSDVKLGLHLGTVSRYTENDVAVPGMLTAPMVVSTLDTDGSILRKQYQVDTTIDASLAYDDGVTAGKKIPGFSFSGNQITLVDNGSHGTVTISPVFSNHSGDYYIEALRTFMPSSGSSSSPITTIMASTRYKLGLTGSGTDSTVQIQDSSGDRITDTAALSVGSLYTEGRRSGWSWAQGKMDWPSQMQALGERTSFNISYPGATVGEKVPETFKLVEDSTKSSNGYVKLYRSYVDENNPGNLIAAIQIGDWYTEGRQSVSSNIQVGTYCEYGGDDNSDGHSSGTITLEHDDSVTVYGRYRIGTGGYVNADSSNRITIKSKPAGSSVSSNNININPNTISLVSSIPSNATNADTLRSTCIAAESGHKIVKFIVSITGTSASKTYYMDFS